jgi:hypothetical protein
MEDLTKELEVLHPSLMLNFQYNLKILMIFSLKEFSKAKSNSIIQKALIKFLSEDLVKKRDVGNIILYSVNLDNSAVFAYFDILIKERNPKL